MAVATILHVGEDFCRRIPVLERAGFSVRETKGSISAIERAFSDGDIFSAVTFHCDLVELPVAMVKTTRAHSTAPCILFANPALQLEETEFDLVIPALTPPGLWLKRLRDLIEASLRLHEQARQLRQDYAAARSKSGALRAQSARLRVSPIDADALWHGASGDLKSKK